jgi:hypothetical protein
MLNIGNALTLHTASDTFLATNRPGDSPIMLASKLIEASPENVLG